MHLKVCGITENTHSLGLWSKSMWVTPVYLVIEQSVQSMQAIFTICDLLWQTRNQVVLTYVSFYMIWSTSSLYCQLLVKQDTNTLRLVLLFFKSRSHMLDMHKLNWSRFLLCWLWETTIAQEVFSLYLVYSPAMKKHLEAISLFYIEMGSTLYGGSTPKDKFSLFFENFLIDYFTMF